MNEDVGREDGEARHEVSVSGVRVSAKAGHHPAGLTLLPAAPSSKFRPGRADTRVSGHPNDSERAPLKIAFNIKSSFYAKVLRGIDPLPLR